jgi:hypothetical protein
MHQAGDRAGERSGDVDHVECILSRAIAQIGDGRERANQNQSCQHLMLLHQWLMDASSLIAGPRGSGQALETSGLQEPDHFAAPVGVVALKAYEPHKNRLVAVGRILANRK